MNQLLLDYFDQLVGRAEDVGKLNAAILQLAVQGKLVAQDPNDEPASELLKRIAAEKKRLKIKSEPLPEIGEEERPFPLPDGWEWVRLPQIGEINPRNYAGDNVETSFVPMTLISETFGQAHKSEIRPWSEIRSGFTHFQNDDVVVAKITPCFQNGKSAIMRNLKNGIGAGTTELYVFRRYTLDILPEYVYSFFNTPKFRQDGQSKMKGTAGQQRVPKDYILNVPFPLPPLAEQKRIVERVDALLAQTRELESRLSQAETTLTALHETAVNTLLSATDPDDFTVRWQFIAENFNLLYDETYPETAVANIAQLKQAILQLAVQGKLTHQELQDEPASALLQRIAAEKERLGIKSKELAVIGEGERPFALPDGWEWVRFIDVANIASNLTKPQLYPDMPHIAPNNIEKGSGKLLAYQTVAEDEVKSAKNHFFSGQIIYSKIRPNLSKAVIVDFEGLCSADMYPLDSFIYNHYLLLYILSETFLKFATSNDTRVAMPKINQTELNKIPIAVPPLAEQKRIVTRVNALLRLCDELSTHIQEAQATRVALRDAVLGS